MNPRAIPGELEERLDEVPISLLAEYLCRRLSIDTGEREIRILFRDGRYERGHVTISRSFGDLRR